MPFQEPDEKAPTTKERYGNWHLQKQKQCLKPIL